MTYQQCDRSFMLCMCLKCVQTCRMRSAAVVPWLISVLLGSTLRSWAQYPDIHAGHPGMHMGMPNRILRWGYLAWGSEMMNCNGWLAQRYKRRNRIADFPTCGYGGRGLFNMMPTMTANDMIYGS